MSNRKLRYLKHNHNNPVYHYEQEGTSNHNSGPFPSII